MSTYIDCGDCLWLVWVHCRALLCQRVFTLYYLCLLDLSFFLRLQLLHPACLFSISHLPFPAQSISHFRMGVAASQGAAQLSTAPENLLGSLESPVSSLGVSASLESIYNHFCFQFLTFVSPARANFSLNFSLCLCLCLGPRHFQTTFVSFRSGCFPYQPQPKPKQNSTFVLYLPKKCRKND